MPSKTAMFAPASGETAALEQQSPEFNLFLTSARAALDF
jgi:hypothetical protein